MKTVATAISDKGLKRDGNEDQYFIDESLGVYVVCDGMGGHAAGEVAAERAIEFATEYLAKNREVLSNASQSPDGFFRALKTVEEAVQIAGHELFQLAASSSVYAGMGTTMTMLVIIQDKAVMAHVGDSRLYLMRRSDVHQLSSDHTLANEMFLSGGITKEQAATSCYQHILTRSIGPHKHIDVDTLLFDLVPGDRLLLCSDGLSNYFGSTTDVASFMAQPSIVERPDQLVEFAKKRGGADNITAIVIEVQGDQSGQPVADYERKLDRLRETFLCEKLSVQRLLHVLAVAKTIQCAAGKELISIGEPLLGFYLVLEGRFRVIDDELVEAELGPGDYIGETALLADATSPASLVAEEPSRVLLLGKTEFGKLTRRLPRLGNVMLRNLGSHLSNQAVVDTDVEPISLDDTMPLE